MHTAQKNIVLRALAQNMSCAAVARVYRLSLKEVEFLAGKRSSTFPSKHELGKFTELERNAIRLMAEGHKRHVVEANFGPIPDLDGVA